MNQIYDYEKIRDKNLYKIFIIDEFSILEWKSLKISKIL